MGILSPSETWDNYLVAIDLTLSNAEAEYNDELVVLINQMPHISDLLTAKEYIQVDNQAMSEKQMTDEEIVKFVSGAEVQEPENSEEAEPLVKVMDALEGLMNVVRYLQQNDLVGIDFVTMKMLNSLKHQIVQKNIENKWQSSLIKYFQNNKSD